MSAIFGKPATKTATSQQTSSSSSSSNNQAYPMLSQALGGQVNNATGASNSLAALLGVGGDPSAQQEAFKQFRDSTGYQFGLNQGTQAIDNNAASRGLLNSGSTAKALDVFGQNYANSQYQNFLNPLQSLVQSGNQAGSVISGAGQQSQSQSQSQGTSNEKSTGEKKGLGGFIGKLGTGIATGGLRL